MRITKISEQFGDYLYHRLPKVYRDYDVAIDRRVETEDGEIKVKRFYTLQEYLYSFADGGFKPLLEDLEAIISLIDPMQCPEEFIPILLQHFGLNFIEDIPVKFQRRLIQNIVTLYKKKGTIPAVAFLARELSGFDVSIEETERGGVEFALVKLSAYENEDAELLLAQEIVQRYIHLFLPSNAKAEVVVTYGFTEGIHFNSSIPINDYTGNDIELSNSAFDHVKYDVDDDDSKHAGYVFDFYTYEHSALIEKCVEEDFALIKSSYEFDEATLENYDFTPFDISSFTNSLDEGDFVYTNGFCCEDSIIESCESDTGVVEFFNINNPVVDNMTIKASELIEECPVVNCTTNIEKGEVIEFVDSETNQKYYFTSPIFIPCSDNYPTHFVIDKYNKSVKVYMNLMEYILDGSKPCIPVEGYHSFEIGDDFLYSLISNNYDYVFKVTGATLDKAGYYGDGESGITYIDITNITAYVSNTQITDAVSMESHLSKNPIHLTVIPRRDRLMYFETDLVDNYTSKTPAKSLNTEYSKDTYLSYPRRLIHNNVGFFFTDSGSNKVQVKLPITLCSMNGKSDFIEKVNGRYYIHHWIDYIDDFEYFLYYNAKGIVISATLIPELDCYTPSEYGDDSANHRWFMPMLIHHIPDDAGLDIINGWGSVEELSVTRQSSSNYNIILKTNGLNVLSYSFPSSYRDVYMKNQMNRLRDMIALSNTDHLIYYERKTAPRIEEITDKDLINKLNLLPIPNNYAKIYSKDIPFSEFKMSIKSKTYY